MKFKGRTVGTGTPGIFDGLSSDSQLFEPTDLCFDFDSAIICCFGGNSNSCIKLHSEVDFACMFMSKIRQIYHVIGFRCKKEENHLAQVGKNPETPFVKGTTMLADSLAYLDNLISLRKDYLKLPTAGPEGTVYHASVQGFSETVTALLSHIQSFLLLGEQDTIENLSLYPFVNESRKEHGFAKHKHQGQYRHPTQQQHMRSKGRHDIQLIKRICQCRHAYHTNVCSACQPAHQSNLSSVQTIEKYKKCSEKFHPKLQADNSELPKSDLKVAQLLNSLTKPRSSQNI